MSPIIPEPEPDPLDVKVRCPPDLVKELDAVAKAENETRPDGKKLSRNDVIVHFLRWAVAQWKGDAKERKPKSGRGSSTT